MPGTKDVGENIKELREANKRKPGGKKRKEKQIKAIALNQAREAGANIPPPRGRSQRR